jgi:hypothetical protein
MKQKFTPKIEKKEKEQALIDLKRYLENFIKNHQGQSLHLIDIANHIGIIKEFDKKIK